MGHLRNAYSFYRREGVKSTLIEAVRHAVMHVRRRVLMAQWRYQGCATVTVRGTQIRLYADTRPERRALWWLQFNERDQLKEVLDLIDSDDVFYDIGANIGYYTCPIAVLTDATVHAFEPHPGNVTRITENLTLNNAVAVVHELALGAENAKTTFATSTPDQPGFGHSVVTQQPGPDETTQNLTVQQRTVDDVVETGDAPPPTVVKIDVEGSEPNVLDGMVTQLESGSIHTIFLEIHNPSSHRLSVEDFGSSEAEILARLRDLGFEIDSKNPGEPEHHLVATRP